MKDRLTYMQLRSKFDEIRYNLDKHRCNLNELNCNFDECIYATKMQVTCNIDELWMQIRCNLEAT